MVEKPTFRQGRITTATLPEVVRDLWKSRASGTLVIESGPTNKRIMFQKGDVVFAATNVEAERLGERLVREGRIKRSVLELALRVMERSRERLGTTMIEWGWVSPMDMGRAVATQIKDIIYSVFSWSSGEYRFEPEEKPLAPDLVLELPTAEVIYEGCRRMSDIRAIRAGLGSPSVILGLSTGGYQGFPVTQEDGYILARVDGRASILDVASASPFGEEEALRRIYAMVLAGVLERRETAASPSASESPAPSAHTPSEPERRFRDSVIARHTAMKFGNYYDRLGISSGASEKRIRETYEGVVRSLEPEASFRDKLEDLKKRIDEVRAKVVEAHQTLSDPGRRREYDRTLSENDSEATIAAPPLPSRPVASKPKPAPAPPPKSKVSRKAKQEAEINFNEANRHWQAGDYFDAIASMNEAVRLNPDKASYHRVLGRWLAENPSCAEAAREHFEKAIALDPEDREAHIGLAKLFETEGELEKARVIYAKLSASAELPRH